MSRSKIGIINYQMGNLLSVFSAVKSLGAPVEICAQPEMLYAVDKIILPGVGAFKQGMLTLKTLGFIEALNDLVIKQGKPILGICLGMQMMAHQSDEDGKSQGLSWFDAEVVKLMPNDKKLRVPHMGWNEVTLKEECRLVKTVARKNANFYFVHSYHMKCNNKNDIRGICHYGEEITAIVNKNNIFAVQFHPEKSQDDGLQILENFITMDV